MVLILAAICGEATAQQDAAQGAYDLSKYILTPKAAPTPRINGARVFGVRPDSKFLFTIAATGNRPMTFSAEGLPRGLKLDPATGRITGRVKRPGEYIPWEDDPETKDIDPYSYNEEAGTVNLHLYKEPRFYASVGYDRGTYRFNGGKMTIKARKGEPQGFTGSYDDEYQSYNGYFCQKWVNEQSKAKLNSSGNYAVDTYMYYVYPYMRVAELYLSYAEADFEYDGTLSDYGYECLNKIRSRCGLPTFQESWSKAGGIPTGDKLRDIIRRERSIEFMLEGRRFHDIRRWKIAEECMRPTPKAWNIEGDTAEKFYKLGSMKENDTRIFSSPKHYWLAIPNSQLNINGKLVQNPGY